MARRPSPTIANPEYLADERVKEQFIEQLENVDDFNQSMSGAGQAFLEGRISAGEFVAQGDREMMAHFPEDYGLDIPEGGAWIMVKSKPHCNIDVPVLSIWWAQPQVREGMKFKRGIKGGYPRHAAEILTPEGALVLWPHEYTKDKDITKWVGLEEDGVEMHWMGTDGVDDERLFYMQCRGIPRREGLLSLLGELGGPYLYFTLPEEYAAYFGLAA
jgi:hypothetical protein